MMLLFTLRSKIDIIKEVYSYKRKGLLIMKVVAVSDAFMEEKYYRDCFAEFLAEFELETVVYFGTPDMFVRMDIVHQMEC